MMPNVHSIYYHVKNTKTDLNHKMSSTYLKIFTLLILGIFLNTSCYALDKNFFSITSTESTPEFDNIFIPAGSIKYESSTFQELMYSSPESKKLSVQLATLISNNQKIDRIRALTSYKGIIFTASSGTIKGSFQQSGSNYFPGDEDVNDFYQRTLLPQNRTFSGQSEFWGNRKTTK